MTKKEEIIDELKRVSKVLGTNSFSQKTFSQNAQISIGKVSYHLGNWSDAMSAAGLKPIDLKEHNRNQGLKQAIDRDDLLLDLLRLHNEFGVVPGYSLVCSKGKYSDGPYKKHWKDYGTAFQYAKNKFPEKIKENKANIFDQKKAPQVKLVPKTSNPQERKKRRAIGEPISFRGLSHAPINEQGVVYLFGMVSNELGFQIETVRQAFPDCEGKRCYDKEKNLWEHVKIEFEYKSSNFKEHGHDEDECDLIVCWVHNWENCPLEVLELRETIKYLST